MLDYKTEKELEIEAMEKQERVEQYRRLEDAMYNDMILKTICCIPLAGIRKSRLRLD